MGPDSAAFSCRLHYVATLCTGGAVFSGLMNGAALAPYLILEGRTALHVTVGDLSWYVHLCIVPEFCPTTHWRRLVLACVELYLRLAICLSG